MKFIPLIFLAFMVGEIAAFILVGQRIGILATMGLVFAGFVGGSLLIRSTGLGLAQVMRRRPADAHEAAQIASTATYRMMAGVLLMVPGFLSDIAAALLLIPKVQQYLRGKVTGGFADARTEWPTPGREQGPVIEGEAIEIEGEIERQPSDKPEA